VNADDDCERASASERAATNGLRGRGTQDWQDVGDVAEVVKRKKFVVGDGPDAKVVIVRDNCVYALDNVCIHKQRELVKGVVLGDRIVCPGHQWAFNLATGFEAKMERYQPTYPVRVTDEGRVEVDLANPSAERPAASPDLVVDRLGIETVDTQIAE
jgi:nitrite reductase (NADH) small subunit